MNHSEHVSAIELFNASTQRVVGGCDDGECRQPTEFGLILIGAGVPVWLSEISQYSEGKFTTTPDAVKSRFRAARFLRELANQIEARDLLDSVKQEQERMKPKGDEAALSF